MAIQQALWNIQGKPTELKPIRMDSELRLEQLIADDISILEPSWMLIGRQVQTSFNTYIDLLAIDVTGSLIIIELKKDKTPRDVVAQAIDYACWVDDLSSEKVIKIYQKYCTKYNRDSSGFEIDFEKKFVTEKLRQSTTVDW